MKITFPGGMKVNASFAGFEIVTDQRAEAGGNSEAPAPFEYFLSSLGTCAGAYILGFCKSRGIDASGIEIDQKVKYDQIRKRIAKVELQVNLPDDFPEKYRSAVIRAADQCAVKKYLEEPFEVETIANQKTMA